MRGWWRPEGPTAEWGWAEDLGCAQGKRVADPLWCVMNSTMKKVQWTCVGFSLGVTEANGFRKENGSENEAEGKG